VLTARRNHVESRGTVGVVMTTIAMKSIRSVMIAGLHKCVTQIIVLIMHRVVEVAMPVTGGRPKSVVISGTILVVQEIVGRLCGVRMIARVAQLQHIMGATIIHHVFQLVPIAAMAEAAVEARKMTLE